MQTTLFIGLDVHKATISVAVAYAGRVGDAVHPSTTPSRADDLRKLAETLTGHWRPLQLS